MGRKKEKYCWLQHGFCLNILNKWVEKIIVIEKPINVNFMLLENKCQPNYKCIFHVINYGETFDY